MTETSPASKPKRERTYASGARGKPMILRGTVVSTKMLKTLTVEVDRTVMHRKYKKYVRITTKLHVHDEKGEARTGDEVQILECRPYSKTKHFRLDKVIKHKAQGGDQ
jgi:small subunit ribosomal protein S17